MSRHLIKLAWIAAALITYTSTAFASLPTGIIAHVTSVQVMKSKPAKLKITGAFKIVTDPVNNTYSAVQVGYMYFVCPKNQEKTCQLEWDDLRKVANHATDCAMFGNLKGKNGTVRPTGTPLSSPDTYPIQLGVLITPHALGHCAALKSTATPDAGSGGTKDAGANADQSSSTDGAAPAADSAAPTADSAAPAADSAAPTADSAAPTADSAAPTPDSSGNNNKADDGGCAVANGDGSPLWPSLLLLVGCALLLARRRRRS